MERKLNKCKAVCGKCLALQIKDSARKFYYRRPRRSVHLKLGFHEKWLKELVINVYLYINY